TGNMSDEDAQLYIDLAENHPSETVVSPVSMNSGVPMITFSIKRIDDSVDFFVFNLSQFSKVITDYASQGSYAELIANGSTIFSNKHGNNL
ncbi:methyl-accepting chemotaxis protein, partial [Vibrio parahaemolyticus]|nr:methyl-accepting chemotaxis protein [Vibrio parahaemolyticus]